MKRLWILMLCCLLVMTAVSCDSEKNKKKIGIALIPTEQSIIDDHSFNSGALEGIKRYSEEHAVEYEVYVPSAKNEKEYLAAIEKAAEDGAKIIITPGFDFETTVFEAQNKHPDVKFVLIDGAPNNGKDGEERVEKIAENTYSVMFAEEQAGFLAGYSAVKDGFRKLGFLGGREFPTVVCFGYGFIQGAEYAAGELNLKDKEIDIVYGYCGDFLTNAKNQTKASSWYNSGTDVIFACGGAIGFSVMAAAESYQDKYVIGVDLDQCEDSERVITSSLKMIGNAVYSAIDSYYKNQFPGGKSVHLGINEDGIGIAMDTARFKSFSKDDYQKIYEALKTDRNGIRTGIDNDFSVVFSELDMKHVKITEKH